MLKRQIFYCFHYDNDVFRVQQIRNIGGHRGKQTGNSQRMETYQAEWRQVH